MKTIEELKKEQYDLKAKLHEVIEFTNSEEYFTLSDREKGLIGQQRAGMEVYLNALAKRIYDKDEHSFDLSSVMWPMLLGSVFSNSSYGSTSSSEQLKKELDKVELKESEDANIDE